LATIATSSACDAAHAFGRAFCGNLFATEVATRVPPLKAGFLAKASSRGGHSKHRRVNSRTGWKIPLNGFDFARLQMAP
jgi:hypothetical protein